MVIYNTVRRVCEEQRNIVDGNIDLAMLSSTLTALPRLKELTLCFCETVEREQEWLESYLGFDMTMVEKSHEHHIRVVTNAARSARNSGVSIHAMHLSGFCLPYYRPRKVPDLSTLSECLNELVVQVQILRLSDSGSLPELFSHYALNLCRFDMCRLTVKRTTLKNLLEANMQSIRSIGFHDVRVTGENQMESNPPDLSPELLCSMLEVAPLSIVYRAAGCECLPAWKMGWRLLLSDDHPRGPAGGSLKRKFNEM